MADNTWENADFDGNAVRDISSAVPRTKKEQKELDNLIRYDQKRYRKARHKEYKFSSLVKTFAIVASFVGLIAFSLVGQVEINELNTAIAGSEDTLKELQSEEIQLNMQAVNSLNAVQLQAYVEQNLDMAKINENQIIYVNMTNQDKGTVYVQQEKNFFENILSFFGF